MACNGRRLPYLGGFDQTLAFLREGYDFISRRCELLNSDFFRTRLMFRSVICMRGERAAELFYGSDRFTRRGAMPWFVLQLLQDKGSVQQLDDGAHRHRKTMFIRLLMNENAERRLLELFIAEWRIALKQWIDRPSVVLFDEVNHILTRTICRWMGVPFDEPSGQRMTRDLSVMIEHTGRISPSMWVALFRRRQLEHRLADLIGRLRTRDLFQTPPSPLASIAQFRDRNGRHLSCNEAAVETLNILRPTVAIGRFIMFAALALHENPRWRIHLRNQDNPTYECFAEEVRRLYPFFPVIGGIARQSFDWDGIQFNSGEWVLLDLHGSNHDPRVFPKPTQFNPERALS